MSQNANQIKVLFLDFDGVLHPDEVFLTERGPELRVTGQLFMWTPLLAEVLSEFPQVDIVLSTSWAREFGFHRARRSLLPELQSRVIGATWHSQMGKGWPDQIWWDAVSRYEQICRFAERARLPGWVAVDDDARGWPDDHRGKLVLCNSALGLAEEGCRTQLRNLLAELCV